MIQKIDEVTMVIMIDDEGGERKGEQRLWREEKVQLLFLREKNGARILFLSGQCSHGRRREDGLEIT